MPRKHEFEKAEVLELATVLFWSQGCQATSPMQLATEMGLSKSSLYNTFHSKQQLYLECLQAYVDKRVVIFRGIFNEYDFPIAIEMIFQRTLDALIIKNRRGCFIVNSAVELSPHDREVEAVVLKGFQRIEKTIYKGLLNAQEKGIVAKSHDAEALAKFYLSNINGLQVMSKSNPRREPLEKIIKIVLSIL